MVKKAWIKSVRLSTRCAVCGGPPDHFHHRDPKTRLFMMSRAHHKSWAAIKAELAKCVVLCELCHSKEHL
jgi:ribosomal protein S14